MQSASNVLWILDGANWVAVSPDGFIRDIFWQDGLLHVMRTYPQEIQTLDNGQWVTVVEAIEGIFDFDTTSLDLNGGRLISGNAGETCFFAAGSLDPVAPPLGFLSGLLDYQDQTHALLSEGTHLVATDYGWRLMGTPLSGFELSYPVALTTDQSDRLMLLDEDQIAIWTGDGYEVQEFPDAQWYGSFVQPDGSLFLYGHDQWGRYNGGVVTDYYDYPPNWSTLRGAVLEEGGNGWVAERYRLSRLTAGVLTTELFVQGWIIAGLMQDPVQGLVVYGSGRVLVRDDPGFLDITPRFPSGDGTIPAQISSLLSDGQGGLLAWEPEREYLMHYDGMSWTIQTNPGFSTRRRSTSLVPNPDGSFYLFMRGGRNEAFRVDPVVAP